MKKIGLLIIILAVLLVGPAMAGWNPANCNVYEMGSSFTFTKGSLGTTSSQNSFGGDYSVSFSGVGTASAWINAHIMEGGTGFVANDVFDPLNGFTYDKILLNPDLTSNLQAGKYAKGFMQSVDLVYQEKTTASGVITNFEKSMSITNLNSGFCSFC